MPETRTFTEKELEAITADTVKREVAAATEKAEADLTEARNKIDTLEAEKAALVKERDDLKAELEQERQKAEREKEVTQRREARVAAVKELSGEAFGEEYFTAERAQRWAEMADEDFEAFLNDLADSVVATIGLDAEKAQELAGKTGEDRRKAIAAALKARQSNGTPVLPKQTAAFRGGQPAGGAPTPNGSSLRELLAKR